MRKIGWLGAAAGVLASAQLSGRSAEPPKSKPMKTAATPAYSNRLVNEKSPYLLQHAHNPVDWYPWGEEAFAKARKEDKPIFLSIGYSTCHWCHVMAHESFEDPASAAVMNERFVNIKVDREERPDVDRVYMTFVQATTGSGGWPMSVWLTPDLKPFAGGTYFPPSDRYGRPGFTTILKRLSDAWKNERARVVEQGDQMIAALREHAQADAKPGESVDESSLVEGFEQIARSFDPELGGFGGAPKFPRPVTLNFLFRVYACEGAKSERGKRALEMSLVTLRKMAEGGMHDHLGGGFHRYSVDKFWHIPHFEKMLYDQAQLALSYVDAFQITRDSSFEKTARDILDYVRRDLTDKAGGFYSAEDADSVIEHGKPAHAEGAFYVWTQDEIVRVLGDKPAALFKYFYGVERDGNAPEGSDPHEEFKGKNTLIQRHTIEEAASRWKRSVGETEQELTESRRQLFEVRAKRPRPHLDDKIITAWNGLMISAFARAYQVLNDRAYLESANRAADFLVKHLWDREQGILIRSYREGASSVAGFADDYAFLIQGLLDLYEAGGDPARLQWALELQEKQDGQFLDRDGGGYFSGTGKDPNILLRMKEDYDGAEPSPNSVAAMNLLRLAQMTGAEGWRKEADRTMHAFAGQLKKVPSAMPQMLTALAYSLEKPTQVVIAGVPGETDTSALLRQVHQHFLPNKILLHADGGAGQKFLAAKEPFLESVAPIDGKAAAYVCENFSCKLPTNDPAKLSELLTGG